MTLNFHINGFFGYRIILGLILLLCSENITLCIERVIKLPSIFVSMDFFGYREIILGLILLLCSENTLPRVGHGKK